MTVEILTGDCRDVLKTMPDESVDCILTDPPYGETSLDWDRWQVGWLSAARRVLKKTGSMWCFGSMRMFLEHADELAGWKLAQDVVWEKHNGSGFHADRFKRVHEHVLQLYRDDARWSEVYKVPQFTNDATARVVRKKGRPAHMGHIEAAAYVSEDGGPRLMRSVIYCRSEHGRAVHPTQKPLGVIEPLLLFSCPEGGTVLDCFAGSGSTGLAAKRNRRNAILIEAREEFARLAGARITNDAPLLAEVSA